MHRVAVFRKPQTINEIKRSYAARVVRFGQTQQVRFVPYDFPPLSVGVICSVMMVVISFLFLQMGTGWGEQPGVIAKGAIALGIGLAAGAFDFFQTRVAVDRGRWNLVLDQANGTLQLPSPGTFGEPSLIDLNRIARCQIETVRPDPEKGGRAFYRLSVLCQQQSGDLRDGSTREGVVGHTFAQSHDKLRLEATASWLEEFLEMDLELDEVEVAFSRVPRRQALSLSME